MSRTVTLVLMDGAGTLLGALPPYEVALPWWQEVTDVIDAARTRHDLDIAVLRLLSADRPAPPGGAVTYLAQCAGAGPIGLAAVDADLALAPHPLRMPWAQPGGPASSLSWAAATLAGLGRRPAGAVQQRTWNLSAIWRLHTDTGPVWLKQIPAFFAHEPVVLGWLANAAPGLSPTLLATHNGRMLLEHVPGTDRYGASPAERLAMLIDLHTVQRRAADHVDMLVAQGVPDLRATPLTATVRRVVQRYGAGIGPGLLRLLDGLDARLAALDACAMPDTLVHGDFHPGNVRADDNQRVLIDWGDSFIGHPAFDVIRLVEDLPPDSAAELVARWCEQWRSSVPECMPQRALGLLAPIAALRHAAVYAGFVERIEPSERPYHAQDIGDWLHRAVAATTELPFDAARNIAPRSSAGDEGG